MKANLKAGERIDDLEYKGLKIIQNPEFFCFGTDAVLLSSFVSLKAGDKVVDFCTGTGIIPILLSGQNIASSFVGIEIQQGCADMAKRSVSLNSLEEKINIIEDDLLNASDYIKDSIDVVTVNPPYEKLIGGIKPQGEYNKIARFEVNITFKDIAQNAAKLLKNKGRFYMIHKSSRMAECLITLSSAGLEAKRIQFVQAKENTLPKLFLLECVRGARHGIIVETPLVLYNKKGEYTKKLREIYHID